MTIMKFDMKIKATFLAFIAILASSVPAWADYTAKQYIWERIEGVGKVYPSESAYCNAYARYLERINPSLRFQLGAIDRQEIEINGVPIRNQIFGTCNLRGFSRATGEQVSTGSASFEMESYCQSDSPEEGMTAQALLYQEYSSLQGTYGGAGVEARYNQGGNRLKTCHCIEPEWRQVGNKCVPAALAGTVKIEEKNASNNTGVCAIGNPINPATGAKYLTELDFEGRTGGFPLRFERRYTSQSAAAQAMGWGWRHSYNRGLAFDQADALPRVRAERPDGGVTVFQQQADGTYSQDPDINDRLSATRSGTTITGYELTVAEGTEGLGVVEAYDAQGKLLSIRNLGGWVQTMVWSTTTTTSDIAPGAGYLIGVNDSSSRTLQLRYDEGGRLVQLLDPAGNPYTYSYDDSGNLASITNPANHQRRYHYNEAHRIQREDGSYGNAGEQANWPNLLTGITDQAAVRFADYYYRFDGKGVQTTHALGANRHTLSYGTDGRTQVTDPLGQARTYEFSVTQGVAQPKEKDLPCSADSPYRTEQLDANGNPQYRIDFDGNRTDYVFDTVRNLETSRREGLTATGAATTETRTITTEWHPTLRQPLRVAQPLKITTYTHFPNGLVQTVTERATTDTTGALGLTAPVDAAVAPRTWAYTYNADGQVLTINGPRTDVSDVTTFEYFTTTEAAATPRWHRGDLRRVVDALGFVTTFDEYDRRGNPLQITDPNGLVSRYVYDNRGLLQSRTVGGLTTSLTYDSRNLLQTVTEPQGQVWTHAYDDAHRLVRITDVDGNRIEYTQLDGMGNRLQERVYNALNVLVRQQTRTFNSLNRLEQVIGATTPATQITRFEYTLGGNLRRLLDPLARETTHTYDALNRLRETTSPVPDVGVARPVTRYGYNGQDQLNEITDPRSLRTTYAVDGLANRRTVSSPDSGTQTSVFDAAGNPSESTDARGQRTQYTYDALNRMTRARFQDGSRQDFGYDVGGNAIGRLSSIREYDPAGVLVTELAIGYDQLGRITQQTRTIAGFSHVTQYAFDTSGRLSSMTYPSGRRVVHTHDTAGRVSGVSTAMGVAAPLPVVSAVRYHPFGDVAQFTYGNSQTHVRSIDLDGRPTGYRLGSTAYAVDYDPADQITAIRNLAAPAQSNTYTWDGLGRIRGAVLPSATYGYQHDAVGNRSAFTTSGVSTTYNYPTSSNKLSSIGSTAWTFDANGNVQSNGAGTFAHDVKQRMSSFTATAGAVTQYVVDAQGMRVRKNNAQGDVVFVYDQLGKLIAEVAPNGTVIKEYIFLGELPVGVVAH